MSASFRPTRQGGRTEIDERIFHVGEQFLERPHPLIRHILEGEDDPPFLSPHQRDGMPELVVFNSIPRN